MAKGGNENRSENQIEIELGKLSNENLGEVRWCNNVNNDVSKRYCIKVLYFYFTLPLYLYFELYFIDLFDNLKNKIF